MVAYRRAQLALCWFQGLYFAATGIWPLISVDTFQAVTGRKSDHLIAERPTEADHWMLYTISVLILAISIVLLRAAWRRRISGDVAWLAALSAAALAGIDIVYVARGVLRPIYLLDAAIEIGIIITWLAARTALTSELISARKKSRRSAVSGEASA